MAHPLSFNLPTEPQGIEYLIELALDLRGTWEHAADELWGQLDPELWRLTLNPWAVLQAVSHVRLKALAADSAFCQQAAALVSVRVHSLWPCRAAPTKSLKHVCLSASTSPTPIYNEGSLKKDIALRQSAHHWTMVLGI
jgi:hypothetical protein